MLLLEQNEKVSPIAKFVYSSIQMTVDVDCLHLLSRESLWNRRRQVN